MIKGREKRRCKIYKYFIGSNRTNVMREGIQHSGTGVLKSSIIYGSFIKVQGDKERNILVTKIW